MSKNYTFLKPIIKSSNDFIILDLVVNEDITISTNKFISTYKISNLWKGKFFIKKLIKRVFKYRLKVPMLWNSKIWDMIKIYELEYNYKFPSNINNVKQLSEVLSKSDTKKRFNDINKYKELLKEGVDLNLPLFMSGKALNFIGGNVDDNEIYFLDGTRRLLANILNGGSKNKAVLIDY
tara:strand:- start:213 stop:749 length:537 start_codon:yes stop_codon:yes gene_type:complete